jgi:two-component system, OmpR family, sensor kinase
MSLRARLLAGMGFVAIVLLVVSIVVTSTTRDQLIEQVDSRLESLAQGSTASDGDPDRSPNGGQQRVSDAYQGVVNADGALTTRFAPNAGNGEYAVPEITMADLPTQGDRLFTTSSTAGVTYRVLARRTGDSVEIIAVAIDDVQTTITRLVWVEVVGSAGILLALGMVGWWVIHLGIRPVKEMTAISTRIADGDTSVRIPETSRGTESDDLARALNRMLAAQAASEERLRRFVADASHELRTPITTIRGYSELYRQGGLATPSALADAMRRTEQEAGRMGRLVEDMLMLAKLDAERPLQRCAVDIAILAADAVADARAVAPGRTVHFEGSAGEAVVLGDEDRLRQAINNVVGNALVHTDADVAVVVRCVALATAVRVDVEDHGEGMPAAVADRVTERFFRADPARARHRGGSGLGLSIVDAIATAHGGTVEVDSRTGRGTIVRITLPASS